MPNPTYMCKVLKIEVVPGVHKRVPIHGNLTLGREEQVDIVLPDLSVSGRHSMIEAEGKNHYIRDLGSTNGTIVNNVKVEERRKLLSGDIIYIGYCRILFLEEEITPPQQLLTLDDGVPWQEISDAKSFHLEFDGSKRSKAIQSLEKKIAQLPLSKVARNNFTAAITEVIENAFRHGNQGDAQKKIKCYFYDDKQETVVTIEDAGLGFNFEEKYTRFGQREGQKRSPGLSLIRQSVDFIEYNGKGNQVTLRKKRKSAQESASSNSYHKNQQQIVALLRVGKRMVLSTLLLLSLLFPLTFLGLAQSFNSVSTASLSPTLVTIATYIRLENLGVLLGIAILIIGGILNRQLDRAWKKVDFAENEIPKK